MARGDDDGHEKGGPFGDLFREAVALEKAGRWGDAAARFDDVLAQIDHHSDGHQDLGLSAMYMKVVCLQKQDDAQRTLAACDELVANYGSMSDQRAVGFLADTLWLKARALGLLGNHQQEREVLRELIEQYGNEPRAGSQVARAMYNEGVHLRETGRGEDAVQIWDELFLRFAQDPPKSDPFIPIRGQLAKSHYLAGTDRLDAALVTCDRMLKECARLGLPEARAAEIRRTAQGCMTVARRSSGLSARLRSLVKRG